MKLKPSWDDAQRAPLPSIRRPFAFKISTPEERFRRRRRGRMVVRQIVQPQPKAQDEK
jgi:hypothetical protein